MSEGRFSLILVCAGAIALLLAAGCSGGSNGAPDASYGNPPDAPAQQPDAAPSADASKMQPDAGSTDAARDGGAAARDGGAGVGPDADTNPCSPSDTNGACTGKDEVCQPSGVCAAPLSGLDLSRHPLLISELQASPATTSASAGAYVEVLNVTRESILLDGLEIHDSAGHSVSAPNGFILQARATAVFVASTDQTMNGDISADGSLGSVTLDPSGDTISIQYMGTTIHQVTYPGTGNDLDNTHLDAQSGDSTQLDQAYLNAIEAGTSGTPQWCLTPQTSGNAYIFNATSTDYGTPGATNVTCPP